MDRARFQRMKSLVERVLELDEAERAPFLDRECRGDEELRAAVDRLLARSIESGRLERLLNDVDEALDPTGWEATATGASPSPVPIRGARVGPYRLREKIGEGGMGEVWVAEQTEPVRRRVALKIIKRGMNSDQIVARFEAERQALAMMDHPAIAKVFDAGQTPDGRPFFVMEYIEGVPITEHCDRHALDTRARLELFVKVCEAVQHAHQKAVIHRDLKPSNILVAVTGEKPEPKIIDFGVAKATAQRLTEKTVYTELGVLIGTPAYMSPEQAEMTGQSVDTRTDVYALSVLLYELLTGVLPFSARELRAAGFDEIRRQIREVDPPRPSTRLASLSGDTSECSARNRRSTLGALTRQIRGDLDWITMKGLEKDRTRRYGSASELAMDIGRYLRDEPVTAGPPSGVYRARKFVKRHRVAVAVASLLVVMLTGFFIVTTLQSRRIAREAATAEQVSGFLIGLFEVSNPSEARGNTITAREILDRAAEKIESELADQPEVQARMRHTIGSVYRQLGLHAPAKRLLEAAADARRIGLGEDHPDTLSTLTELAITIAQHGDYEEAARLDEEILSRKRRVLGPDDPRTLSTMTNLANRYRRLGRYDDAEALARDALEARRRVQGPEDPQTLKTAGALALILNRQGRLGEAEALAAEILNVRRRVLGEDHPDTVASQEKLAETLIRQRRLDEALRIYEMTLDYHRRVYGPQNPNALGTMNNLAIVLRQLGRIDEAERLYREAIGIGERVDGPDHPLTLERRRNLALLYRHAQRYEEAEKEMAEIVEAHTRSLGAEHPDSIKSRRILASILLEAGKLDEARTRYLESLKDHRRVLGPEHWETGGVLYELGLLHARQGETDRAIEYYEQAADIEQNSLGPENPRTLGTLNNLAGQYLLAGRLNEAESMYRMSYEGRMRALKEGDHEIAQSAINLARVAAVRGDPEQALDWLQRAVELGCGHADHMLGDRQLQSLQGHPRLSAIVEQARKNQE